MPIAIPLTSLSAPAAYFLFTIAIVLPDTLILYIGIIEVEKSYLIPAFFNSAPTFINDVAFFTAASTLSNSESYFPSFTDSFMKFFKDELFGRFIS